MFSKMIRGVVTITLLIPLLFSFFFSPIEAQAVGGGGIVGGVGQEAREYIDRQGTSDGIRTKSTFRERRNERFHYKLEATMHDQERSFYDLAGKTSDAIFTSYSENIMFWANSVFDTNVKLGGLAVWAYEMAVDSYIVEFSVESIGNKIRQQVGVFDRANPKFGTGGFFFSIFKVIALFVVIYAFYKLVWERSFVRSFGELLKFIVVLTVSLLLFMNYGSFLIGMEKISTEASGLVTGGSSQSERFSEYLWTNFVDNPYLYLQYGTTDVEEIGEERIHELLTAPIGSGARKEIVDNEVGELDNFYMSYESAPEKFMNSIVLWALAIVAFFPVFIMSLFIEFTQIWFVIIALLAPFALMIASFPSQFGVLKRYLFELSLPLVIKIAMHFLLTIFLFVLSMLGEMDMESNEYFLGGQLKESLYGAIIVFFMFIGIFLLRKRILNMFSSGSEFVGSVREGLSGMKEGATKPVTETVKTGALVGGAVAGGIIGGGNPYSIAMGASAGKAAGDIATGGKGPADTVSEGVGQYTRLKAYQDFEAHREEQRVDRDMAQKEREQQEQDKRLAEHEREQQRAKQMLERGMSPEQRERAQIAEEIRLEEADKGYKETFALMDENNVAQSAQEDFYNEIHAQGIEMSEIDSDVLKRHIDDGASFDKPKDFVARLKTEQLANEQLRMAEKRQGIADFKNYLGSKNLTESEIEDISSRLQRKAIDVHKLPQSMLDEVDEEVIQDLASGEADDYSQAFVNKVDYRLKEQEAKEQRERLLRNRTIDPTDNRGHSGGQNTSSERTPYDFENTNQAESDRTHYQESARQNEQQGGTESNWSNLEPPTETGQQEQASNESRTDYQESARQNEQRGGTESNWSNLEPPTETGQQEQTSTGEQHEGARTQYQEDARKSEYLNKGETKYDELE